MKHVSLENKRVIISRTDSIGDVMLTLPVCAWIKEHFPTAHILFLGKGYTKPVVEAYQLVDEYVDWAEIEQLEQTSRLAAFSELNADVIVHVFPNKSIARLAKRAQIPVRVGTSHRSFHLLTCNYKVNFTRKQSPLHEAQLNHELLRPFGLTTLPSLTELNSITRHFVPEKVQLPDELQNVLQTASKCTILHPKSQGSAREWPMENYLALTSMLLEIGHTVIFTGTAKEGEQFSSDLPKHERVLDTTGKLSLQQLIYLIQQSTNLVACSTGPLHIAGYVGIRTVGLFSPRKPIHPGRWKALGSQIRIVTYDDQCPTCASGKECNCISQIPPERVLEQIV